jgi:DNA-binding IclR family transcriptional regulator
MAHDRVEAVERALTLLNTFNEEERTLSLVDLADRTGFYKSTILRLNRSLERFGYLTRHSDGSYGLGPALWRLGSIYRKDFDLGEHIRPALRRLRDDTGETASFYIRDGDTRVCLYRLNSDRAIRHHLDEGVNFPLDRGAAGKLLEAFSKTELNNELHKIRQQGYAVSLGERDADIAAVAVPLLKPDGSIRGALCISGLISRFNKKCQQACVKSLQREAGELENKLMGN